MSILDGLNERDAYTVRQAVLSASLCDWITESRARELLGTTVTETRSAIQADAGQLPEGMEAELVMFLDDLEDLKANSGEQYGVYAHSQLEAVRLHPVTIRTERNIRGAWEVIERDGVEIARLLGSLGTHTISGILAAWGTLTPSALWHRP